MPFVMPGVCKYGLAIEVLKADEASLKNLDFIFSSNKEIIEMIDENVSIKLVTVIYIRAFFIKSKYFLFLMSTIFLKSYGQPNKYQ